MTTWYFAGKLAYSKRPYVARYAYLADVRIQYEKVIDLTGIHDNPAICGIFADRYDICL